MEHLRTKLQLKYDSDFSVTYQLNKFEGIFNWYPYTEGFSRFFVERMINYYDITKQDLVLDPFGGCGTTPLTCKMTGINSISIEVNPFMNFVSKVKLNSLELDVSELRNLCFMLKNVINANKNINPFIPSFLFNKKFFNESNIKQACIIKKSINGLNASQSYKDFFLLMMCSLLVKISNMKRAVDLRYREILPGKINVYNLFFKKVNSCINDLKETKTKPANIKIINADITNETDKFRECFGKVDYFITSPPYLNGTNYDRNTKLELAFLEFIKSDADLRALRAKMITAGINSTMTNNKYTVHLDFIEKLLAKVRKSAYDRRIPIMVGGYFNDMNLAIGNISALMKNAGHGVIVVGDSQFGGVHIETDLILAKICELNSLTVERIDTVRDRKSKNGMKLRESLIFVRK